MENVDSYYNWDKFKNMYLEDSFVLEINEMSNSFIFKIEAVLTENHPFYEKPREKEEYFYKDAIIVFPNTTLVKWIYKNSGIISIDAKNERDLGNIDIFYKNENGYYLEGDWGKVLICSDEVKITYL